MADGDEMGGDLGVSEVLFVSEAVGSGAVD